MTDNFKKFRNNTYANHSNNMFRRGVFSIKMTLTNLSASLYQALSTATAFLRLAMNSRIRGRKNALLNFPIGGSDSR